MRLRDHFPPWLNQRADYWPDETNTELSGRERQGVVAQVIGREAVARLETDTTQEIGDVLAAIKAEQQTIVEAQLALAQLHERRRGHQEMVSQLPEIYSLFFNMDRVDAILSLSRLASTKTDMENRKGGENAPKYLIEGALGLRDKRDPITVRPAAVQPGGVQIFEIVDGNGTFTAVQAAGWEGLPVQFEQPPHNDH